MISLARYRLLAALRVLDAASPMELRRYTGLKPAAVRAGLADTVAMGLVTRQGTHYTTTHQGRAALGRHIAGRRRNGPT